MCCFFFGISLVFLQQQIQQLLSEMEQLKQHNKDLQAQFLEQNQQQDLRDEQQRQLHLQQQRQLQLQLERQQEEYEEKLLLQQQAHDEHVTDLVKDYEDRSVNVDVVAKRQRSVIVGADKFFYRLQQQKQRLAQQQPDQQQQQQLLSQLSVLKRANEQLR
jgi:hypothetical protein